MVLHPDKGLAEASTAVHPTPNAASSPEPMDGPSHPPLSCGKPKYLVVLLHGEGSSGEAVIELAVEWAATLNKAEFMAPCAPWRSSDADAGRQWTNPADSGRKGAKSIDEAVENLHRFLDEALAKYRLKHSQLALVGFSQGAAVALRAGLARPESVGAIVAVGRGMDESLGTFQHPRSAPPVLLVSADLESDPACVSMEETENRLRNWQLPVTRIAHPGDYFGLDDDGLCKIANYLREALVGPTAEAT